MIELLKSLPPSVLILACVLVGYFCLSLIKLIAWFFREWWAERKNRIERQTNALMQNTMAITKLEVQVEKLNEYLTEIPKIKRDLDSAHEKIRDLSK